MVDDDLCGESAADGPIRVSGLQGILDALDICHAAAVEGGAKADDQQFVFADLIPIAGIVQVGIAGIAAKVVGVSVLAFHQLFLGIGQGVPCLLGSFALGVGVIGALLHIDGIDQVCTFLCGHFVCISLVCAFSGCFGAYSQQGGGQSQCGQHGSGLFQVVVFHVFCFLSPMANPFAEKQVQETKPRRSSFADKAATKKRGTFCVQNGNAKRPPDFP